MHGPARLDDARLLGRDRGQRVAEKFLMVESDRRDADGGRIGDDIGRIERPPRPTSSTSGIGSWRENARNAAAVVISKKVIG